MRVTTLYNITNSYNNNVITSCLFWLVLAEGKCALLVNINYSIIVSTIRSLYVMMDMSWLDLRIDNYFHDAIL